MTRPGLVVLYRHSYYASPAPVPLDHRRMLTYNRATAAANYPRPVPDIPVRETAIASKPPGQEVLVELTIDPARLSFRQANGRNVADVDVLVGCVDGRDVLLAQVWQRVELSSTDQRLEEVKRAGVPIAPTLPVPGRVSAARREKLVVYDYGSDLVGSVFLPAR